MSQEELRRVEVLARVRSNQLRVVDASRLLGVSYRQAKRLWKRYREAGPASLKHRSAGCTSNHAYAPKLRQRVLDLVRKKYGGPVGERFGPTLAAEHLDAEDGLVLNAETLRLWMLEAATAMGGRNSIITAAWSRRWDVSGRLPSVPCHKMTRRSQCSRVP
jgi:Helix-turn-helix domain